MRRWHTQLPVRLRHTHASRESVRVHWEAHLVDGRYTLTVDVPDGLRCGNVYYGSALATRDTYSWDPVTLRGTLQSAFDAGCDGAPGTLTYPFTLARM